MWLILQQDKPDDYVLATGETHTVREFVEKSFEKVGIKVEWQGKGISEKGIISKIDNNINHLKEGDIVVEIDPRYFRPTEVDILVGDATKARNKLGWKPRYTFEQLIDDMIEADLRLAEKEIHLKKGGYWKQGFEE